MVLFYFSIGITLATLTINFFMDNNPKHNADSGNDSTNEILQKEKLIDPGNEHSHNKQDDNKMQNNQKNKRDADAGGDGTGTTGPAR